MKKSLIALAALATVGAAQAQSSVTVYGIADVGVFNVTNANAAGDSRAQVGSGVSHTSRLGFRGTEDLGGGMKANFGLESGLNLDTGSAGAGSAVSATTEASAAQGSKLFDRQATVGLEIGKFRIDLGRQNSLLTDSTGAADPLGFTFVAFNPNVTYTALNALPGSSGYGAASHINTAAGTNSVSGTASASLFRLDNSAKAQYTTGVGRVGLMFSSGDQINNSAGNVQAINASTKIANVTLVGAYLQASNAALPKADLKAHVIGAVAPVGKFTFRATVSEQKFESAALGKTKVLGLGASYPISAKSTLTAVFYDADNNSTNADLKGEQRQYGAVLQHDLSKRTGVYATAMARKYKDGASIFRTTATASKDSDMITAVGIRHSF